MSYEKPFLRSSLALLCCASTALPGFAADPAVPANLPAPVERTPQVTPAELMDVPVLSAPATPTAPAGPSQNVTINLINRLVERGVLTKQDASDLIKQAEADATIARLQAATTQHDAAAARDAAQAAVAQVAPPPADGAVRVTYIPEVVKTQMRDQIKDEVMAQARMENWAAPRTLPEWATRFSFSGDIRMRYEGMFFPGGNDNTGAFPNFNSINTGAPFDVSGNVFSPQHDVDQNRTRFRLRARFGVQVDLGEGFTAGFRIGTGNDNNPVTENQSLGAANGGQGGDFSKYALWLDRAFLKYEIGNQPNKKLALTVGRFDNPFFSPTLMVWADDIGFDGAALQGKYEIYKGVTPFLNAGAFPVFNTDLDYATNQPAKFQSEDKYLYAGQLGATWKINQDFSFKAAGAYYYFQNIEGKRSDPFTPLTSSDAGNTDDSRPSFAQTGNTYMALRDIVPNASNNFGTIDQFQYFGLATPFHELVVNGRLDYSHFEPFVISLSGEYVKNLAFDRSAIDAIAVNNRGPNSSMGSTGAFSGGDTAWIINLTVGCPALEKRWDWNAYVNYRYVESDAVVDGFTDADFGGSLLGTNHRGYTVGGNLALGARVWLGVRYMGATEIAGPPYKNDLIQVDINGKF
jgi:hypothetical protein